MFLSKVNDQKLELMRAVFQNMYLKEKNDYLDSECKMLAEQVISSQVRNAHKGESASILEKELNSLKKIQQEEEQALIVAKKKIEELSSTLEKTKSAAFDSFTRSKSINDDLALKDEMIECLHQELTEVRLVQAEKYELIRELQEIKNGLEKDKEALIARKPVAVSKLQEELMSTNLAVMKYNSEFNKIKKQLAKMKANKIDDADLVLLNNNKDLEAKNESVKLTSKGAAWKKKGRKEIDESLARIKQLETEKINLQQRIQELQKKLDVMNIHLQYKEEEMGELYDKLNYTKMKQRNQEKIMAGRKREYKYLEDNLMKKITETQQSSVEKSQIIDDLTNKLSTLKARRESNVSGKLATKEQNTVEALEKQILELQEQIKALNRDGFDSGV